MAWRQTNTSVMLAKKTHFTRWDRFDSRGEDLSGTPRHYSREHGFLSEPIVSSHVQLTFLIAHRMLSLGYLDQFSLLFYVTEFVLPFVAFR